MQSAWDENTMDMSFVPGMTSADNFSSLNGLIQDFDRFDMDKALADCGLHLDEPDQVSDRAQLPTNPLAVARTSRARSRKKGRLLADLTIEAPRRSLKTAIVNIPGRQPIMQKNGSTRTHATTPQSTFYGEYWVRTVGFKASSSDRIDISYPYLNRQAVEPMRYMVFGTRQH